MGTFGRRVVFILAVALATICGVLLAKIPEADADGPFDLRQSAITYRRFFPDGSDPLITDNGLPNRTLGVELNLQLDLDVFKYFYWNNTVHSLTDKVVSADDSTCCGQFRMVGWEFGFGLDLRRIWSQIPVTAGYYHYSQHALDTSYPWHYPVRDAIELKLILYQRKD